MNEQYSGLLIDYGRLLMAQVAAGESAAGPPWVAPFLDLLAGERPAEPPTTPLRSIFTLVDRAGQQAAQAYVRPVPLSLDAASGRPGEWPLMPVKAGDVAARDRASLYDQFTQAVEEQPEDLRRFFHVMRKYASTLPNTYGEPGVSLFEQWKMVAALVQIAGTTARVPDRLGLVGGDIPGIQRTINLVTSKGAAKAMRGRSAFIQLLGHALVDTLLDELGLGPANVVYDAGGNFLLLTGWDEGLPAKVKEIESRVNQVLLGGAGEGNERFDGFHGDLAVALAATQLRRAALRSGGSGLQQDLAREAGDRHESAWQTAERELKDKVAAAKARPFGDLAQASRAGWRMLFDPEPSETDEFCAVCRRQRAASETFVSLGPEAPEDISIRATQQCPECAGFAELAQALARRSARLIVDDGRPQHTSSWQRALHAVSGRWYRIGASEDTGQATLALDLDGFPAAGVDGFQPLVRTTPLTERGNIKPNDVLAEASEGGLKRLGVLRMDVDDLGDIIVNGLPQRSPMATAELSQALERFFAAWLDRICARVDEGRSLFYTLFAGGDDLFVIGPWTLMVPLAQAIQQDFQRYVGGHAAIHISAGVAIVGGKSPLYLAADLADEALQQAKHLDQDPSALGKNAITFLGRTYHWDALKEVQQLQEMLVALVKEDDLPSSLLTTLQAIERRYRLDQESGRGSWGRGQGADGAPEARVFFGPWMWRQAYALSRMRGRYRRSEQKLNNLETSLLDGRIEDLGLAARWAQWLVRKET